MKISETWLREWADPDVSTENLSHQLTMAGLEVDGVESYGADIDKVVVGQVLSVERHPNADKLSLCEVDVGNANPLTIVCGASNVRAQGRYPTARVGALLPDGTKIKRAKIRGQNSEGMLCSARELGLGDDAEGLYELDKSAEVGADIAAVLALNDQIFDLDLTPNRADCFCVSGVAREVAAINELDFHEPETRPVKPAIDDTVAVELLAEEACPRFAGRVIRNLDPQAATPDWMQERLRRSGLHPIQPVVDVTNYVMLELGQPMHGYDLAALNGNIVVRFASAGETLKILGGEQIDLPDDALIIADASGPVGLAGIVGGEPTAVTAETTGVFLESAFFCPSAIAGRGRRFGLHTDASLRFERGVDPDQQTRAIERATELLVGIAGGEPGPVVEMTSAENLPRREQITLRADRLSGVLGVDIPSKRVREILGRLHMDVSATKGGWKVRAPTARFDIQIEEDLIEEVIRLYGYDHVPEIPGQASPRLAAATESRVPMNRIRAALVDRDYQETMTYSFVDPHINAKFAGDAAALALTNPISSDQSVMRTSLWPGLVQTLVTNLNRQQTRVRIYEVGVRFIPQASDIIEEEIIAGLVAGSRYPEHWDSPGDRADFFDIKNDVEAILGLTGANREYAFAADQHPALRPGCTARIKRSGQAVGWLGELHPALVADLGFAHAPLLFELQVKPAFAARTLAYSEISRYPAVRRDLAVVVDQALPVADIETAVREAAGPVLRNMAIFDVYSGKGIDIGRKSVAFGLILQETSRTLTDAEADGVINTVADCLSDKFEAKRRE